MSEIIVLRHNLCPKYCHKCPDLSGDIMPGCMVGAVYNDLDRCTCDRPTGKSRKTMLACSDDPVAKATGWTLDPIRQPPLELIHADCDKRIKELELECKLLKLANGVRIRKQVYIEAMEKALRRISSEHQRYDDQAIHDGTSYGIGVVDGHRCAGKIAREALTTSHLLNLSTEDISLREDAHNREGESWENQGERPDGSFDND